jgi:hypothetical protein
LIDARTIPKDPVDSLLGDDERRREEDLLPTVPPGTG